MDYKKILEEIYNEIQPYKEIGQQATYIPELAKINPDQFGMCIDSLDGKSYSLGQSDKPFSIQSIVKVFALAMWLHFEGDKLWQGVGKER